MADTYIRQMTQKTLDLTNETNVIKQNFSKDGSYCMCGVQNFRHVLDPGSPSLMSSQNSTLAESRSTHDLKKHHGRVSWKKNQTFVLVIVVKLTNFHFIAKKSLCRTKTIAHRMVRTAATSPGKLNLSAHVCDNAIFSRSRGVCCRFLTFACQFRYTEFAFIILFYFEEIVPKILMVMTIRTCKQ